MIKLNAQGVFDKDKANPNIRHKYVPDVTLHAGIDEKGLPKLIKNRELPEDDQVYVICDHIIVADGDKYNRIRMDNTVSIAGIDLFREKVREIHNLQHPKEDREITVEELLNAFGSIDATAIKTDVVRHLMESSMLGDGEVKN